MPPSATLIGVLGPSVEQFRQKNPSPLGTANCCPCSPHSVGHSVKIKKYMVTHTRKSYSKGCNICIGNDGFFLGKRLSMGFHRSIVEPADPLELDPPTLKCAIPRFQRGPTVLLSPIRQALQICDQLCKFHFCSLKSVDTSWN